MKLTLEEEDISVFYNKSSNFTNPSLPQIEMINIGHKNLLIIIGPYVQQLSCYSNVCEIRFKPKSRKIVKWLNL